MKKTVKVLFSLVLVCLFAVQFAGAMPASASADRVDSKWDNVQLDTSVYVYGDDGAVKQDGDFGVKAGFSGADLENLVNEAALLAARQGKKAITEKEMPTAATLCVLIVPTK